MSSAAERRAEQFTSEIESMRLKTGHSRSERRAEFVALAAMAIGLALAVVAYVSSLGVSATPGSNIDVLNSNSHQILALIGVGVGVCGGLVFLRYSLAGFLRVWLLRQIYEQRVAIDEATRQSGPTDTP